jgi:hypothetical protein
MSGPEVEFDFDTDVQIGLPEYVDVDTAGLTAQERIEESNKYPERMRELEREITSSRHALYESERKREEEYTGIRDWCNKSRAIGRRRRPRL